jgi:hypothetical protein
MLQSLAARRNQPMSSSPIVESTLHQRYFGGELGKFIDGKSLYGRCAHVARGGNCHGEFCHGLAIGQIESGDDVVPSSGHVGARQSATHPFGHPPRCRRAFAGVFRAPYALFGPVEKTNECCRGALPDREDLSLLCIAPFVFCDCDLVHTAQRARQTKETLENNHAFKAETRLSERSATGQNLLHRLMARLYA